MQPFIPDPATRVQQILSNSVDKSSSSTSTSTTTTTRTVAESGEAEKRSAGCEASPEVVRGWGPRARARPEGGRPGCLAARRSSTRCRQVRWKAEKIWKPVDGRNRDGKLFEQLQSFFLTLLGIISTSLLLFVALRVLDEHGHVKYLISNRGQASLL